MKLRILVGFLSLALVGCAQETGVVYKQPIKDAHRILETTGIPPLVFGRYVPEFTVDASNPLKVTWTLKIDGIEALLLNAELKSVDQQSTRVSVDISGPNKGEFSYVKQKLADNLSIKRLYTVALEENVGSALEHRPFDLTKIYPMMAAAALANYGELYGRGQAAAAEAQKNDRNNIAKAYADEAEREGR